MADCNGTCSSCASKGGCSTPENKALEETLGKIRHVFFVLSGKGGVGKSTVSANLAAGLTLRGQRTGLLDVDLHGPSIPMLFGLQNTRAVSDGEKLLPLQHGGLKIMSTAFLLEQPDAPVVWRGPMKAGVIRQFIEDVAWGELDYLIVDCPPGTGDEPLSVCQLIPKADGAVIVTTPQDVAASDVAKSIVFCAQIGVRVLGIVENMSGFICPCCNTCTPIFKTGGGETLAKKYHAPFLGRLPIVPEIGLSGDGGKPFVETDIPAAADFLAMVDSLIAATR